MAGQISGRCPRGDFEDELAAVLLVPLLTDLGEAEPRDRGQGCDVAGADRGPHGADAGFGGGRRSSSRSIVLAQPRRRYAGSTE
jgi:hypothetical protein